MNKRNFYAVFFVLLTSIQIFGQKEIIPPPPPPPQLDFRWELDKKTEAKYLKNINENLREQLEQIKEIDVNKYNNLLQQTYFKSLRFPFFDSDSKELNELDRKILEMDIHTEALAAKYSKANKSEKEKLENNLKEQLSKLFALKEKRKYKEVADLEKELEDLKKGLKLREKNKDKIIERRLLELLGEGDYLEW
ncbi:MAG: hypothetical protein GXO87_00405 [Chlorobi bacterium]|nr:hypothetical protein [Chlorobiota bacterium]